MSEVPVYGVTFGNTHSYKDWGVYWNGFSDTPPIPTRSLIEVPFRNGLLDVTGALTDKIFYGSRKLKLDFLVGDHDLSWPALKSKIYDAIHGQSTHIILDTDPDYYWDAYVCQVSSPSMSDGIGSFSIDCECFPYKMKNQLTSKTITVNGSNISQVFSNSRLEVNPTFVTNAQVQVIWSGSGIETSIVMSAGTHTYENIEFVQGDNTLVFNKLSSNATVVVSYREGDL